MYGVGAGGTVLQRLMTRIFLIHEIANDTEWRRSMNDPLFIDERKIRRPIEAGYLLEAKSRAISSIQTKSIDMTRDMVEQLLSFYKPAAEYMFIDVFGFTHAESTTAIGVTEGKITSEIAEKRGLTASTIGKQFQSICEKTRSRRRPGLISTLLSVPLLGGSPYFRSRIKLTGPEEKFIVSVTKPKGIQYFIGRGPVGLYRDVADSILEKIRSSDMEEIMLSMFQGDQ